MSLLVSDEARISRLLPVVKNGLSVTSRLVPFRLEREGGLLCLRVRVTQLLRAGHRAIAEVPDDEAAPDIRLVNAAVSTATRGLNCHTGGRSLP